MFKDKPEVWIAIACIAILLIVSFLSIRSTGAVDYCWITAETRPNIPDVYYFLYGHRSWKIDVQMGVFKSFEEAIEAANKISCPLHK